MHILQRIVRLVEHCEKALCAFSAAAFTILIVLNVVLRYAFGKPIYFAEELSTILMIWMALLAASITLGQRQMVSVTFLIDYFPEKTRSVVNLVAEILVLAIAMIFSYWSIVWITSPAAARDMIITMPVEKWYSYLIVPAFFLLSSLKSINNIFYFIGEAQK